MATLTYASLLLGSPADRAFRDHRNAFETSDARFVGEYRLTKVVTRWLCDQLRGKLQRRPEGPCVLTVEPVLAALRFYAAGGFRGTVGSDENIGVHQCSVSRVLGDVTNAIIDCLRSNWLCFQQTQAEKVLTKRKFFERCKFSGVIDKYSKYSYTIQHDCVFI
ncbi:hypothetical protein ISCGN_000937 [Ixodes scapularis]